MSQILRLKYFPVFKQFPVPVILESTEIGVTYIQNLNFCRRCYSRRWLSENKGYNQRRYNSTGKTAPHLEQSLPKQHKKTNLLEQARKQYLRDLVSTLESISHKERNTAIEIDGDTWKNTFGNFSKQLKEFDPKRKQKSKPSDIANVKTKPAVETKTKVTKKKTIEKKKPGRQALKDADSLKKSRGTELVTASTESKHSSTSGHLNEHLNEEQVFEHYEYTMADELTSDSLMLGELQTVMPGDGLSSEDSEYLQNYISQVRYKTPAADKSRVQKKPAKIRKKKKDEAVTGPLWTARDLEDITSIQEVSQQILAKFQKKLSRGVKKKAVKVEEGKELAYHQEVTAYVEACIRAGMLKDAQALVVVPYINSKKRKHETKHNFKLIKDLHIYNMLMHGMAKKGKLDAIQRLILQMEDLGVSADFQTYAACLECLGRSKTVNQPVLRLILADIKHAGLDLQDICNKTRLQRDEWIAIEKAIKTVIPDFKPRPPPDLEGYDCLLLNELNDSTESIKNPFAGVVEYEDLLQRATRQIEMELQDKVLVQSIEPAVEETQTVKEARDKLEKVKNQWKKTLRESFERNKKYLEMKSKDEMTSNILPYLKLFGPSVYVHLMLQEIDQLAKDANHFSPGQGVLNANLGYKLWQKFMKEQRIKQDFVGKLRKLQKDYLKSYAGETVSGNHRECWHEAIRRTHDGTPLEPCNQRWPYPVAMKVGRFLYQILLANIKVDASLLKDVSNRSEIPAFYNVFRQRNESHQEEIKPHPALVRLYQEAKIKELTFHPNEMPSLSPPIPWTNPTAGGDTLGTTELIKNAWHSPQQMKLLQCCPTQQLSPVYDAINAVTACPWKINIPILDTLTEVFNNGGDSMLDIAEPASKCAESPRIHQNMTPEQKLDVIFERNKIFKKKKEMHSLWCTELYRLSFANKYRNEIFWFPHNLDFRGRVYALPPHFNHLGGDISRSILVFAKGKPLGPHGLDWIKIHLVNLTGFKKRSSNEDRLAYADELMDDILDSADRPLNGNKWWQKSDEPWQTLACCMEIANITRSSDPENYICHYPVHQDGSCNGLQHYAALGRDMEGAKSVNLYPFPVPKDVYSDVVEMVEAERRKDAANGVAIAKVLEGHLVRKVIKQTIMTTVYGVTQYGARQQIRGQLESIPNFAEHHAWTGSFYLADKTFECLQKMFTSTKEIQDWLVICADLISKVPNQAVEWVTPLGWPVFQPYFRHGRTVSADGSKLKYTYEVPNAMKQKNAFPPNFIHSLDSVHMMLTAIHCFRAGISFVSVHDCFWTHACDVGTMNEICRQQFVALHSQPIIEDLAKFMVKKFGFSEREMSSGNSSVRSAQEFVNEVLGRVPKRGNFELEKVLSSTYFFS